MNDLFGKSVAPDSIFGVPKMIWDANEHEWDNMVQRYFQENPELNELPSETRGTIERLIQETRSYILKDKYKGRERRGVGLYNCNLSMERWETRIRELPEMEILDLCTGYYSEKMHRLSKCERAAIYSFGQTKDNQLTEREFKYISGGDISCAILLRLYKDGMLTRAKIKTNYKGKYAYRLADKRFHRWLIMACGEDYSRTNVGRKKNGESELTVSEYMKEASPEPWRINFGEMENSRIAEPIEKAIERIPHINNEQREKIIALLKKSR